MELALQGFQQLRDFYLSLSAGARLLAVLLAAVVVVSLGFLFTQQVEQADAYLLGGRPFTAGELAAIEAAFAKAGLTGAVIEGNRIRVPRGQEALYVGAMADAGAIPPDFHTYLDKALAEQGPFVSPQKREELLRNAKQKELAFIIRSMPGIENAAVHYDVQRKSGLSRQVVATASVSVKPALGQQLDPERARMIKHLVASAIVGLKPENVTVADLNGRVYAGTGDDATGAGSEHKYLSVMHAHQKLIEQNILRALQYVPGVTVSAHVELNPEVEGSKRDVRYDNKNGGQLALREQTMTNRSTTGSPGGRPGLVAQGGANQAAQLSASARSSSSEQEQTMREESTLPAHSVSEIRHIGLTPRRVSVAVGVPSTYFEQIWRKRNPDKAADPEARPDPTEMQQIEQQELEKIRKHVAMLLPPPTDGSDVESLVRVTSFSAVPQESLPEITFADQALGWLGRYWSTLGLLGLSLVGLLMLRKLMQSSAPELPPEAAPPEPAAAGSAAAEEETEQETAKEGTPGWEKPTTLRDQLVEMVRSDPDTAASILKGWIANSLSS